VLRRRRRRAEPTSDDRAPSPVAPPGRFVVDPGPNATPIEVHVQDDQTDVSIDVERWQRLVGDVLAAEYVFGPGEATVVFVDEAAMTALNKLHMGGNGPTDVLSFPIDAGDVTAGIDHRLVGDIVVCPAVAEANAPHHAGALDDEIALLLVHGTLHLLGHDHAEDAERERMWARERELLAQFWGPLAKDPWATT
jgi:probable rRNA maturation factor